MSKNPFVFQGPVVELDAAYFRDTRAVDSIVNGLLLGNYYTLLGPRLSGITSVTWDILRTAREREKHCLCFYVDLKALDAAVDERSLFQGIVKVGQRLPPETELPWSDVTSSARFREALVAAVRDKPARLIVALDHLDSESLPLELVKMLVRCARVLYNQRLTDPECGKISVLIGGSQSPYALSTGSGSPFNIAEKYWLCDLTPQEIEQLVRTGQRLGGIFFDDAAVARITAATEGDKYFVQRICHLCVREAQDAGTQAVTKAMVSRAIEGLVSTDYRMDRSFALLVRSLKHEPDLVGILVDLLEGKEVVAGECQADVNKMQLAGVLKVDEGKYRFRNEVYERFLSRRKAMVKDGWKIHVQAKKIVGLHDVTLGIASTLDPETAFKEATWMVLRASEADTVAVYLFNKIADRFRLEAVASREELHVVDPVLRRDEIARGVIASQRPSIIVENRAFCSECDLHRDPCSCIWLPLVVSGDALGTMVIAFDGHHDFLDENEIKAAEIMASHLAIAVIRNKFVGALQTVGGMDVTGASRDEILREIADEACNLLNVPVALIWGREGNEPNLRVMAHSGNVIEEYIKTFRLRTDVDPTKSFLQRLEPLFVKDIQQAPGYQDKAAAREMGWYSLLTMPLKARGHPIGIIEVYTYEERQVTPWQRALLKLLANQTAVAIENAQLYQRQAEDMATLASLYQISTTLRTSLNPKDVLETVTDTLQKMFDLTTCTIGLLDEAEERLDFVAHRGLEEPTVRLVKDLPQDLWRDVRIEKRRVFLEDVPKHPELTKQLERQDLKSFAVLQLQGKEKCLGILTLGSTERLDLDRPDWDLIIALADQAAVAIENAQLYHEVHQARKALDDSLKVLTHQLRAEPAFVTNTIDTLLAGKLGNLDEKQRDRLEKAQRRLYEHHRLIGNINMYGRLKGGRIIPRRETVQLAQAIRGVVGSYRGEARRRGLTIRTRGLRKLPAIEADEGMIEIVLGNLLDNAVKFTPQGGHICVEAWTDTESVHVVVDDTGPGIPIKEREKVFEEYHQVESTPTRAEKGAGLGLYIAKKFVEMHEGRTAVVDKEGPGTRIEVIMPM